MTAFASVRAATPLMLWWATGIHLGIAVALIIDPDVARFTVLSGLFTLTEYVSTQVMAAALVAAAVLASIALIRDAWMTRWKAIACLFPQYTLILLALISSTWVLITGEFQGNPFPFWAGFVALFPVIWGALLHTWAILDRYFRGWA